MNAPTVSAPLPAGVTFGHFRDAWDRHAATLLELIDWSRARTVCEIGAGANPALPLPFVERRELDYTLLDISAAELAKAPPGYRKLAADICGDALPADAGFDFMFSKMLAEHVPSGAAFHRNVLRLLAPGGLAFHFFPTLYAPAFIANRLLPERLSSAAVQRFAPRDEYQHAKFPAHYSWCRGPTRHQLARLEGLGYEVVSYRGFFGYEYFRRVPIARWASGAATDFLCRHPAPALTSFAFVLLRKPGRAERERGFDARAVQ